MMIEYLLILGTGHLLGDFYLYNEKNVKHRSQQYKYMLLRCVMYYIAALLVILPVFSVDLLLAVTCFAVTHFVVDTIEYLILIKKKMKNDVRFFLADQCIHVICICAFAYMMNVWNFSIGHIKVIEGIIAAFGCNMENMARWLNALLFIHRPVNIFIQKFLEDYKPRGEAAIIKADNKAGRQIGTIERMIMLIFLAMNQYTAIGFVLTAKSIARYDKITKDEKFAEYYLLGTLISTLCVVICRLLIIK